MSPRTFIVVGSPTHVCTDGSRSGGAHLAQLAGGLKAGEGAQKHNHGGHERAGALQDDVLDLRSSTGAE